jgi:3-hydroxy-9,10-secoandrosta-1,3,5(10)-triene-9,17-dione monooxygenase reductase component
MSDQPRLTTTDSANFRNVLGRLPTGVVIITGGDPNRPSGLVVGSFMSVSLDPPLVAVCPALTSQSWTPIAESGHFCANVLAEGQETLARRFSASAATGIDKFDGIGWEPSPATGAPLLEGVAAWIDCRIERTLEAGDHWLVLGEVLELSVHSEESALVFHGGAFRTLA